MLVELDALFVGTNLYPLVTGIFHHWFSHYRGQITIDKLRQSFVSLYKVVQKAGFDNAESLRSIVDIEYEANLGSPGRVYQ